MTVATMHTGRTLPLSNDEWVRWQVYYRRKAQRRELAELTANARRR